MSKNFLDLYDEYKNGYNYLKKKKNKLMINEEKNKKKIEKIDKNILKHQKKFADLWLNVESDKNE
jgi:hypothetical protein